ncbi:hypothetical protein Hte_009477 [Hypoxylon texense]
MASDYSSPTGDEARAGGLPAAEIPAAEVATTRSQDDLTEASSNHATFAGSLTRGPALVPPTTSALALAAATRPHPDPGKAHAVRQGHVRRLGTAGSLLLGVLRRNPAGHGLQGDRQPEHAAEVLPPASVRRGRDVLHAGRPRAGARVPAVRRPQDAAEVRLDDG